MENISVHDSKKHSWGEKSEFIGNQQILTKNGLAQSKLIFTPKQDPAKPIFFVCFCFCKGHML